MTDNIEELNKLAVGIIGHGNDKFTEYGKETAIMIIKELLQNASCLVSGHSPVGGIDIWAEEEAKRMGIPCDIKSPKQTTWNSEYGYKQRNLDIARTSDIVYVLLADSYPDDYKGMRFEYCYHCKTKNHIKSGACWTAHKALGMGKKAQWIIIKNKKPV